MAIECMRRTWWSKQSCWAGFSCSPHASVGVPRIRLGGAYWREGQRGGTASAGSSWTTWTAAGEERETLEAAESKDRSGSSGRQDDTGREEDMEAESSETDSRQVRRALQNRSSQSVLVRGFRRWPVQLGMASRSCGVRAVLGAVGNSRLSVPPRGQEGRTGTARKGGRAAEAWRQQDGAGEAHQGADREQREELRREEHTRGRRRDVYGEKTNQLTGGGVRDTRM